MNKRQVVLIPLHPLFGEGLKKIFQDLDDVDLIDIGCPEVSLIDTCLRDIHPTVVVLAGEKEDDQSTHLISYLLKHFEQIPVIWIDLDSSALRIYTARSLLATSSDLIDAIRNRKWNGENSVSDSER